MLKRLGSYLDDRLGLARFFTVAFNPPLQGGARWSYVVGPAVAWLMVLEFITGLGMMTVYSPSVQTAWSSTFYLQHHFALGPLVRGLHYWTAQAILVGMGVHLVQVLIAGAYRRPREANWWAGLLLLAVVFMFAHSGALLPWDQRAYWTTQVEAGITGSMPVMGPQAMRFLQGGSTLNTLSLTRLYALHVGLLPMLTMLLVAGHIALYRKKGSVQGEDAPPAMRDPATAPRYWQGQAVRDILVTLAVVGLMYLLAVHYGAPLEAPADPNSDYSARPEWYLLALFKLRKSFEGPREFIATMVIPGVVTTFFVALPFLDRAPSRWSRSRVLLVVPSLLIVAWIVGLTVQSYRADARDAAYQRSLAHVEAEARRAEHLARDGVPPEGPLEMMINDPGVRPGQLYDGLCTNCHAARGAPLLDAHGQRTTARAPALEGFGSRAWARSMLNDPQHADLFGRTHIDDMPSQARRLGATLDSVVEYLYAQGYEANEPSPPVEALRAAGDTVYHQRCTSCHQGRGDQSGTDAGDRDAPDLDGWGGRDWIRGQIVRPAAPDRYGANNAMPAFEDELAGRDLEFVVGYVRGLRAGVAPSVTAPPAPSEPAATAEPGDSGAGAPAAAEPATAPRAHSARHARGHARGRH